MSNQDLDKLSKEDLLKLVEEQNSKIGQLEDVNKTQEENLEESKKLLKQQAATIKEADELQQVPAPNTLSYNKKVYKLTIPKSKLNQNLLDTNDDVLLAIGSTIDFKLLSENKKVLGALIKKGFGGLVPLEQ
jgi:hypothetical protein